jgi:hypothetical protein
MDKVFTLKMSKINSEITDQFQDELRQIGYKYKNNLLEWNHVTNILKNEVLPIIYEIFGDRLQALEQELKQLNRKMNQLSFRNDPVRDRRITELFNAGYSRGKIAREVGMSKWGVSKALRRLGVN